MPRKRMNSAVANANGGIESTRALSHARNVLLNHDLKQPVLYHLVFMGSQEIAVYQAVIKSLIRRIRARCRLEYFGAFEIAEDKGGLHAHCYILIETSKKTPFKLLDVNDGEYLHKLAERHELVNARGKTQRIHVSKPKNPMHDGQFFARPTPGPLLDNCLCWIEYPFKCRSKDGIPAREKYFNSEFAANKTKRTAEMQRYYAPAAPAAPQPNESEHEDQFETQPETSPIGSTADQDGADSTSSPCMVDGGRQASATEEGRNEGSSSPNPQRQSREGDATHRPGGIEMKTLTTSQKYVGMLYERCVDQGLDVDEVRRYLLEHGVVRTPGQVAWEMEQVYEFHQYVDMHPAKPRMSVREWDRAIGPA